MLNEASLQNLDNNSYRKESFKKYASLEKPNWKRVGYKYFADQACAKMD